MKYTIWFLLMIMICLGLPFAGTSQEYMHTSQAHPRIDTLLQINGKKLHVRIHGSHDVGVVLINGFGATQNYWNHLIPGIDPTMGVLTYDREGYGKSDYSEEEITIATSSQDLLAILDALGINRPVILAAHSYGGLIARKFLQLYPERVSGLLLIDSSHERTKILMAERLKGKDLELFERFLQGPPMKFPHPGMGAEKAGMQVSEQMLIDDPVLPPIPCIVLTAGNRPAYREFSEEGKKTMIEIDQMLQQELGTRIPGTRYQVVAEGTHNLHVSHPEVVTEAILGLNPVFVQSTWADTTWSMDVALGDIDGDGDPDALVANMRLKPFAFWINDGTGNFIRSEQEFPGSCHGVALGDLDGDNDLDAFIVPNAREPEALQVWMNDGEGVFSGNGQTLGSSPRGLDAQLEDFDHDGDLDAYIQYYQGPNEFLINNGDGRFFSSEPFLMAAVDHPGYCANLNDDPFPDFIIVKDSLLQVYIQDRDGSYQKTAELPGNFSGYRRICFLDYDQDKDLDILVKTAGVPPRLLVNRGGGDLEDQPTRITAGTGKRIVIPVSADFNQDSYPDLLFLIEKEPNQIWLNNQQGGFTDSGARLDSTVFAVRAAAGDLDLDGDQDIFIVTGPKRGEDGLIICPNQIWLNQFIRNNQD